MSITNEDRYHLQQRATKVLGKKEGATLMEMLPPVGWAEVATKRDLDQLTTHMNLKFAQANERFELRLDGTAADLRGDMAGIRAEFEKSLGRMQTVLLSAFIALAGVLIGLSVYGPS